MTRTCHWLKTTFSSRKSFDCICRTHATHQQSISLYISLHKSQLVLIRLWLKFQDRQKNSRIQKIANKSNGPGWASSIDLVLSETNHCRTKEKPTLLPLQRFEKFTLLHLEYDKKIQFLFSRLGMGVRVIWESQYIGTVQIGTVSRGSLKWLENA